ncbi:ABC transporter permease [Laceyella sacchari]|uniref:ABC transporter permease n=1 Tax=Laceyella sacchari TaxID=37482 RepID=A0ABY5U4S0_LACSH|nr:ABC transporter permease [Laceyella sacchari]KPC69338.1 peptide ABC transporter permease [Thermoactinomyces vulgaris]TCW40486.1 oligopeptide transport system permease protein [Laceyella sacchari]UWE04144.1 ABC transporter permease [Laceyella sacchari]
MLRYTLKRLGYMVVTLWLIITITFFIMHLLPGTPLKNEEKIPPQVREQILEQYGLKDPLPVQYVKFMGNLLQGDLGKSMTLDGREVVEFIAQGFPVSAFVGSQAVIFGTLIGLLLGTIAGLNRGKLVDNAAIIVAVLGVSVPSFVMGGFLSYFVGVKLQWLPPGLWESYESSILPSLALSFGVIAQISRYVRTEMVEVLDQDYMKTAKAKGLNRSTVIIRHALRNALIPAVTVLGPLAVNIITGSLVIEQIFALPGLGKFFVQSIQQNDYTMIMGVTVFYSALIIIVIFLVDLLYGLIDPRIRISGAKE